MLQLPGWLENAFMFSSMGSLFAFFIAWIVFARLSMGRIEREIKREGLARPSRWDGVGVRAPSYVISIACPGHGWDDPGNPLIEAALVKRYATKADLVRAWLFITTFALLAVHVILAVVVLDLDHYPD